MGEEAKPDFSGWATKAGIRCADGRIIMPDAFKHQDQARVPLVWQHGHNDPGNVLGHAILEHRDEGVYCYGYFNDTDGAKNAKTLVSHGDIESLSIYANQLTERAKQVFHGIIRELSLVLSGANPGALIDNVTIKHSDGDFVTLEDEAVIYSGEELVHTDLEDDGDDADDSEEQDEQDEQLEHADNEDQGDGPTIQDVYNGMTDDQKAVVHYMVGAALEEANTAAAAKHSDLEETDDADEADESDEEDSELVHSDNENGEEGRRMTRNVFEEQNGGKKTPQHVLSHDAMKGIVADALRVGSLKEAVDNYAVKHGIDDIDVLFPDARTVTDTPEFNSRRTEWVTGVINGTKHSPFSRIKSIVADLTYDEARARGYIKGSFKKEEWFGVAKRTTTPSTIYKKQKLDRDDILDITDFDVVMWLKAEMRLMLDEEIARAVLIGDGRAVDNDDKIKDPAGAQDGAGIRSILHDHDLYATTITLDDDDTPDKVVDAIVGSMQYYKGSGSPTLYTTLSVLTKLLVHRDNDGHRLWRTVSELSSEMGVANIVTVEVMEGEEDLIGIIVNLRDYTIGSDKGGEVNFFDDFDIDYNQYKYLYETRLSGALTKILSAMVVKKAPAGATLVAPEEPDFDGTTLTVKTTPHVTYRNKTTNATLTTGTPVAVAEGESITVEASADAGYYFTSTQGDQWTFKNNG